MTEKTIHCNYCNKDIAKRYYKMHTTTKTHFLNRGWLRPAKPTGGWVEPYQGQGVVGVPDPGQKFSKFW